MTRTKDKLALLQAGHRLKSLEGISRAELSLDKPSQLAWYQGEFLPINKPLPCLYRLPARADVADLAKILEELTAGVTRFVLVFMELLPVYVTLEVTDMKAFLASHQRATATRDLTLFWAQESKALDVHLVEDDLEVRLLSGEKQSLTSLYERVQALPTIMDLADELALIADLQTVERTDLVKHREIFTAILLDLQLSHQDNGIFGVTEENKQVFFGFVRWLRRQESTLGLPLERFVDGFDRNFDGSIVMEEER